MIVLKILLWILLSIIGIILLVCIIPADVDFSYTDGNMKYKIKLWFFDLMDSSKNGFLDKRKRKKKRKKPEKAEELPDVDEDIGDAFDFADEDLGVSPAADDPVSAEEAAPEPETVTEEKPDKKDKKKKDKKKKEEPVSNEAPEDDEDDDEDEEKPKKSLGDKLEMLGGIWLAAKNPLAMIFKGFKFRNFYIDFIIADEDAYKCAIKYGRYSTLTYNGLSLFSRLFTIRFKTVDIQPGFGLDKGRWDTSFSVSFRLGTAVIAGIWFLITYIFRVLIPKKRRARKMKKTAAVQK